MFSEKKLATIGLAGVIAAIGLRGLLGTDTAPSALAQTPKPSVRPDQPPPTLEAIAALEAERDQARRQEQEGKDKVLALEAQLRDARLRYERVRAERKKVEIIKGIQPGQLAITVAKVADPKAGPESAVYAVVETNPDEKRGGVFICSNLETLRQMLAWAKRDLGRRWRVVIRPSGTLLEHQAGEHAFGAAQAAGFEDVDYVADPAEVETSAEFERLGWKSSHRKGIQGRKKGYEGEPK